MRMRRMARGWRLSAPLMLSGVQHYGNTLIRRR